MEINSVNYNECLWSYYILEMKRFTNCCIDKSFTESFVMIVFYIGITSASWMKVTILRPTTLKLIHFHNEPLWPKKLKEVIRQCCKVFPSFINEQEEASLLNEINPHMRRMRYEKSHWDDVMRHFHFVTKWPFLIMLMSTHYAFPIYKDIQAIHLYREREQLNWRQENEVILDRIRKQSFEKDAKHHSFVHILDLHEDGFIKPHIDSVRYCGDVITGVCLLSDAVMRLKHKNQTQELILDLFLQRRSLYRIGEISRYEFYHEILGKAESYFMGYPVPRSRRISIICRDLPRCVQKDQLQATEEKRQLLLQDECGNAS
ncbi:unnamed protein product [Thelazia callipaeda]|uniref:2OG-FeII_Oxy_2 domain-containing protein n=1 Tax=Thelazia callipaeda TaxID=103827 RepID=A0A0N5D6M6_THECL|nr:unnamed protein product [Thelazia callipaeda]